MYIVKDYRDLKLGSIVKLTMKNYTRVHEQFIGFYCSFLQKENKGTSLETKEQIIIGSVSSSEGTTKDLFFVDTENIEEIFCLETAHENCTRISVSLLFVSPEKYLDYGDSVLLRTDTGDWITGFFTYFSEKPKSVMQRAENSIAIAARKTADANMVRIQTIKQENMREFYVFKKAFLVEDF